MLYNEDGTYGPVYSGNWLKAPRHCQGSVEVWDQTIGCPECGMNLWNLPGGKHELPPWSPEEVIAAFTWWDDDGEKFSYNPFFALFNMAHPFQFDDCHDPGDVDDGDWPALELYLESLDGRRGG